MSCIMQIILNYQELAAVEAESNKVSRSFEQ